MNPIEFETNRMDKKHVASVVMKIFNETKVPFRVKELRRGSRFVKVDFVFEGYTLSLTDFDLGEILRLNKKINKYLYLDKQHSLEYLCKNAIKAKLHELVDLEHLAKIQERNVADV